MGWNIPQPSVDMEKEMRRENKRISRTSNKNWIAQNFNRMPKPFE